MYNYRALKKMFYSEGKEISKLADNLDFATIQKLIELIGSCQGNIFTSGCGTSAMAAKKIVHTLSVIDYKAFYLNPSDAVHGALGAVGRKDIVILISKGGDTEELAAFLPNLKEKGVYIIAITENDKSNIAESSDLVFKIFVENELDPYNMLATTSTLAVISLFDVIAVSLMKTNNFSEAQFLNNHPSGDVGKRLDEDVNPR
ncbi:KpsF/GutQ family sugar-phosphate isomerase [Tetragenococcus halophilus]|uniref:KpsF/GutQ family sugar-phosphate isomerase n=1 Tax=Tetragenococcus halophilus TaxID=51669 RepID=UPI000B925693|nr:SIS domain-containing protein [Tetragenococcus halophilus]